MNTATAPAIDPRNPPAVYEWTGPTGVKFREVRSSAGTYYRDTTPAAVVSALDEAIRTGARVRLWLGDVVTGRAWLEEWDVCGTVGRSMGPIKAPLLIPNSQSMGGAIISADSIVRLLVGGAEAYKHPQFSSPVFAVSMAPAHVMPEKGLPVAVLAGGEVHARFKNSAAAARWVAFMEGRRMTK